MKYYAPILVYLTATTVYQIIAKKAPPSLNPFMLLSVAYFVATACCVVLTLLTKNGQPVTVIARELPWTSVILGVSIVGLEASMIYAYRMGWQISLFPTIIYIASIIVFMIVGALFFSEAITIKKTVGMAVCIAGLILMQSQ